MKVRTAILVLALAGRAGAQTSTWRIDVTVGEVAEVAVDYKIGVACDDLSIVRPAIETRGGQNYFIVEGLAAGSTWCRVGTDANLPSYLFQVLVLPRQ